MNSTTAVIASYIGHLPELQRFLEHNIRFNTNFKNTYIILVISSSDVDAFKNLVKEKFEVLKELITIYDFDTLFAKHFNFDISTHDLMNMYDKYTFQSIKKLCGMLEVKTETLMLFDSESYFVRECPLVEYINRFTEKKEIFYTTKLSNTIQEDVVNNVRHILGDSLPENFWPGIVISHQCIYLQSIILDFYNYILSIKDMLKHKYIFIEILLNSYIYTHNERFQYTFVDLTNILEYFENHEHICLCIDINDQNQLVSLYNIYSTYLLFCYCVPLAVDENKTNINTHIIRCIDSIKILNGTPFTYTI
jgi:hypothetical protein